ncbi:MAG TPA: GTPase, partial [Anaeromyxobacteraceae bacterium]
SFVVADIPGLIEGAHEGAGLGHQFLRHVERCRVLVHLVDGAPQGEGRSPRADLDAINAELSAYSPVLAQKPQIVVVNKVDVPEARKGAAALERALARRKKGPKQVLRLSAVTGEGLDAVLDAVAAVLFETKARDRAGGGRKLGKRRAAK